MERMIRDAMMDHLMVNDLIASEKHDFFMRKSCLTNLLETVDVASNALDTANKVNFS